MQNFNYGSLFLADGSGIGYIIAIAILVILAIVGCLLCWRMSAKSLTAKYEKDRGSIDEQRNRMLDDVREESKAIKKEAILEAKEQEIKLRNEFERESKEKRAELQRMENRLNQKEETLEKKRATVSTHSSS